MNIMVYTSSRTFEKFISGVFEQPIEFNTSFDPATFDSDQLHLLHISSFTEEDLNGLKEHVSKDFTIAICSDQPGIKQMLDCVQLGVKGYCNSFMQTNHYRQMLRLLSNGQSWFPPHLLKQTFSLAYKAVSGDSSIDTRLENLTKREKEVALSVSEGLTNRQIANQFDITERTVKTHMTNIFKKLQLKDRVGLVLHLK